MRRWYTPLVAIIAAATALGWSGGSALPLPTQPAPTVQTFAFGGVGTTIEPLELISAHYQREADEEATRVEAARLAEEARIEAEAAAEAARIAEEATRRVAAASARATSDLRVNENVPAAQSGYPPECYGRVLPPDILWHESKCSLDPGLLSPPSFCNGRQCVGPYQLDNGHFWAVSPWNPNVSGACYGLNPATIDGQTACAQRLGLSHW